MDCYLIKRPGSDATVSYGYKTDVLASYGNKEDRIAQRDTPRIGFAYSFMISDLKTALELDRELQNAGNAGTIWAPDWTAFENIGTVRSGTNTYTPVSGITNFADGQTGVLYVSDILWTVVTVNVIHNELVFESTVEYDNALLLPLYACDMTGEPEITQANSLCYTLSVTLEAKRPEFSPVSEWSVKYQGHDVWSGFKVSEDSGIVVRKPEQEVQENDYDIGVRDRFTFFERMYDSFGTTVICEQSELPAFRNFIKRRYGKTYSFFMPAGQAGFQKAGSAGDTVGSYLRIRNNQHDFSARPYIVIQTDETANYAHVIALQDDNGDPVESDYSGEFITLVLEESFSFKYKDIDSVQILYFVRLNDDEVSFGCIGNSGGEKPVYSIDVSMIETDFYDASLIDYEDTWGTVKDLNTLYIFKVSQTDAVLDNADEYGYSIIQNSGDYRNFIVPGRYEGTYAVKTVTSANCWILKPAWGPAVIKPHEDFVFQIEGKFDEYSGDAERSLITSGSTPSYCINLLRKNGYYWIYLGSERRISGTVSYDYISMKMNRWLGDEFGWHEWAVQRHNDKLYFLCDGLLCGVSEDFYGEGYAGANADGAINTPQYQIARHGTVQQFRLAKGINVYSGETGIMNRVYRLNDYSLSKIREFDNATVCIYDFKNYNSAMGHSSLTVGITYYDNFNQTQFICGNTPRARQALRICESQTSGGNNSPSYTKNAAGLLINNSVAWCLHPNIRFEQRYYHDFWFEFTMVLSDDQSWEKQCLFPLRGIMVNILISNGQYTVEACGLGSGIYVNIGEPLTFALGVNSQENKIVTYINGVRSGMIALDAYIAASSVGYISVYPLAVRKGAAVESRSYYLHRLRLIEVCLTTAESYAVESEWTLGDLHTVLFTAEYGAYGIDNVRKLKLKDIESVHPIAPYFSNLRQSNMVNLCNKRWSDGSRKTEIVSPNANAFYTVSLTNPITGETGYGWYYTHENYTGALFESVIGSNETFDPATQQMKIVPIVRGRRYDYEHKNWKTYDATVLNFNRIKIVPPFNNTDYERVGNSLYFHGAGGYPEQAFMIDFLGEEGQLAHSGDNISQDAARWGSEHFIRQVEFVINPPVNFAFEGYDHSSYGVNPTYYSRHMQMWTVNGSNFDSHDFYSDYLVAEGSRYNDYSAYSTMSVKTGCDNWEQWRQRINKNNYVLGRDEEEYTPGKIDDGWVWITQPQLYTSNNVAPVHVVIQFVMTSPLNAGGYYNFGSIQQIEKAWINGKEFKTAELWWKQYKSKFSYNKNNVTINKLTGVTSGFRSVFFGITEKYCHNFMEQAGTGHGGIWGCIYYGGNRGAGGWSRYVSCIKAYETEHYNGDFDASAVMRKLQNERLPAVNITE